MHLRPPRVSAPPHALYAWHSPMHFLHRSSCHRCSHPSCHLLHLPWLGGGARREATPATSRHPLAHRSALRDRMLDALAHLVATIIHGHLPQDLFPFLVSASLVGIPKPGGGIRPIAVGFTLRRISGKVALQLVNDDISVHLKPR